MNQNITNNQDDLIDIEKLFKLFWEKKLWIISITFLSALLSVLIALSIPNTYTSKGLLASTQDDSTFSQMSNMSGIASLAGFNIPKTTQSKTQEAKERIKSFDFFKNYFLPNIKLENLMAVQKWIAKENIIVYDDSIFNSNNKKWVENSVNSKSFMPSLQQSYKTYINSLSINEDEKTGFITLAINHSSPYIAKTWVDIIIENINESMRELDKEKAQNSIIFLSDSSRSTNVQSIKEAISRLLESQMQKLMLASSEDAYIFKVLDSPIAPEIKSSPSRALICITITFIGLILSLILLVIIYFKEILKPN